MKKITLLTLLLVAMGMHLLAQVDQSITKKFSPRVLSRISKITEKTNISVARQLALGNYFKNQDSLALIAYNKGASIDEVNKYYEIGSQELKKILSPVEFSDFEFTNEYASSKFLLAIKYRNELNLTSKQIDTLFALNDKSKAVEKDKIKAFEYKELNSVLTSSEYRKLFEIKYRAKARENATEAWLNIRKLSLASSLDSIAQFSNIFKYELNVLSKAELVSSGLDRPVYKERNHIDLQKPRILIKLEAYTGKLPPSKVSYAIEHRSELGLTMPQVDKLIKYLVTSDSLYQTIKAKGDSSVSFQRLLVISVRTVLTPKQYDNYLIIGNNDKATKNSVDLINQIKKNNLWDRADTATLYSQIRGFQLKKLTLIEREKDNSLTGITDTSLRLGLKPRILYQLDMYNNTLPKSQFAEVLQARQQVSLTGAQIDSILNKAINLEALRASYKHAHKETFYARKFEYENLILIMDAPQFNSFLKVKNTPKAQQKVKVDWDKLKSAGLLVGTDSVKTTKEIFKYELDALVVDERFVNDKSQSNLFAKKNLETQKPQILAKLDEIDKKNIANENLKKGLTW